MKNKMNFIFRLVVAALSLFPPKIQQVFYKTSSLDTQSIDLKVHPHSIWVAYPIINETEILEHLPPDLELTPIRVFQTLPSQKLVFFNFFTVDASTVSPMGGHRLEIMTVVREKTTGKKRFFLLETFKNSNMNIFNHQNKIACNLDNRYSVVGKIRDDPSIKILSSEFAIGCNKKIYHSNHFPHVLTFDENKIKIVKLFSNILVLNTLWESCRAKEPVFSFYYPSSLVFSKHIAPGSFHQEKNQEQNYEDFDIPSLMFLFNDACFL